MTTTLSPILAAALARLVTVLRVLGVHAAATNRLAGHLAVPDPSVQGLRTSAMEVANLIGCNVANQRRDAICGNGRDDIHTLTTFGVVGEAATWLADAMDALVAAEDTTLADRFATEALRLLAWPEAMATLAAVEALCAADIPVCGLLGGFSDALDAYQNAVGKGEVVTARKARDAEDEAHAAEAAATAPDPHEIVTVTANFTGMREDVSRWLAGLADDVDMRRGSGRNEGPVERWSVKMARGESR